MADAAFKTAPFPSYTTEHLREFLSRPGFAEYPTTDAAAAMEAEIARRDRVAAGDWSVMTPSERLRHLRAAG